MKYPKVRCGECGGFVMRSRGDANFALCANGCGRMIRTRGGGSATGWLLEDAAKADELPLATRLDDRIYKKLQFACEGKKWTYASRTEYRPSHKPKGGNILAKVEFETGFALRELEPVQTPAT